MGLFRRIRNPVEGTAQVVACSAMPQRASAATCTLHLVVSVPGRAPYPVQTRKIVKLDRWPYPGMRIPVTVDADNPERLELHWEQLPSNDELARDRSRQLAESLGTAADGQVIPPDAQQMLEQLGVRLSGDGGDAPTVIVGGRVAPGATSAPGGDVDRIGQLERLAALRDHGVLSEQEFAAEKARILGS